MRRGLVGVVASVLAMMLAVPTAGAHTPGRSPERDRSKSVSQQDRAFLVAAAQVALAEVDAGGVALNKAADDAVKAYGQMMIDDHTRQLAEQRPLHLWTATPVPAVPNGEQQAVAISLSELTGAPFDQAYATTQVDGHRDAIALFKTEVQQGSNRAVRDFARMKLPTLRSHLRMAEDLATQVGPPQSTPVSPPTAEMQAVLDARASFDAPPIQDLPPTAARNLPGIPDWLAQAATNQGKPSNPEPVGDIRHLTIPARDGTPLLARVYTPATPGPHPVLVYFHGGGFVVATLDTYDASTRALSNLGDTVVVSVAYRQAPEFKFPTAVTDAFDSYLWVRANTDSLAGDPSRVIVGGESAGGNLAAVVSQIARDTGSPMPAGQLLVYPVTTFNLDTESKAQFAINPNLPLDTEGLKYFGRQYLTRPTDGTSQWASPLRADSLAGLPPTTVILAELDPLRSEGQLYAKRLTVAGVPTTLCQYQGVTHEFFGMGALVPEARDAEQAAGDAIRGRTPASAACRSLG